MKDNVELFRAVIERGFNEGDLSVADEVCAEKFSEHQYPAATDTSGPENLKSIIRGARRQIHGLTLTIEDIVAEGDKVWARIVARGSDPRSGKPIEIDVMDVCRFEDGRMVEHWGVPDRFAMLHQIGALPGPPA
ncbi:MAG: ester cyclase [Rubrobacteraceae bacterium]